MDNIHFINLTTENIGHEHVCCAIGDDKINQQRAALKKAWVMDQLQYGYIFKKADVRGKVFIDYVPAEYAWSPVIAPGYVYIQCFWASGRYQGQGLGARLTDAARSGFISDKKGLTFYYSDICTFVPDYVDIMIGVGEKRGIPSEKIRIKNFKKAQELFAPFGIACVFLDGNFLTQEIMTGSKFGKILENLGRMERG